MSKDSIFVNCWKCKNRFDITRAEKCYEHLNNKIDLKFRGMKKSWTTKCTHCGACICHKVGKMKPICKSLKQNPQMKKQGIKYVMPSVHKRHCKESVE